MGMEKQALLFPGSIEPGLTDEKLKRSIFNTGPHRPLLIWDGNVIDGKRRAKLCHELQCELPVKDFGDDRIGAARMLYTLHPQRAFLMFAHPGITRSALAGLFGVLPHELPCPDALQKAGLPEDKRRRVRGAAICTSEVAVIGGIPIARDKLRKAKAVCKGKGISFSAWIREKIETELLTG